MSTIPKNPNISLHTLVKTEIDGDGDGDGEPGEASGFATYQGTMDNTRIEKIFSDHNRSRRTTPKTNGFSSWDSDSEPEVVGKVFTNDEPWFNLADGYVVHEEDMDEALDRFEAQCDQDTPLKFRPFMKTAVRNLRRSLDNRLKFVFFLDEEDDSAYGRRPGELTSGRRNLSFLSSDLAAGLGPYRPIHRSFEHRALNVIVVIKHVHSMTRVHVIVVIQQLQTKHRLRAKFLLRRGFVEPVLKVRKSLKDRMEITTIH
jgi:hypothetical protein